MLEEHVVTKRILILPDYIERYRVSFDGEIFDTGKKNVFKSVTSFCKYMSENKDMRRRFPSGGDYPGYFGKHFSYDYIER